MSSEFPENECVIALDLGGTWVKGVAQSGPQSGGIASALRRWQNPSSELSSPEQFGKFLESVCLELAGGKAIRSLCIATAGEVDALGDRYLVASAHLGTMATNGWQAPLARSLGCPVTLVNDAEAFALGASERGALPRLGNIGLMPIGTGLGFHVVRDGRSWKPARRLNLLGSTLTPDGTFDAAVSASAVAEQAGGDLVAFLRDVHWEAARLAYLDRLARAAASAVVIYRLDHLILGGGLADAAVAAGVDLGALLAERMPALLPRGLAAASITQLDNSNETLLRGVLALAHGNGVAEAARFSASYETLHTESPQSTAALELGSTFESIQALWEAEQAAGQRLQAALPALAAVAERIANAISHGGRVIYVGAGSSGRIAAMDAVEMPCTYSTQRDQFVAVIAGGASDAALSIEDNNEEDSSAVADLLLLQPTDRDVVIGISASGSAFYVRSALAFARHRGAYSVLIHEGPVEKTFFDTAVELGSGSELVSGSTRMKAGTATKKVANFLSTAAMIRIGKVQDGYMTDFEPTNAKLRVRAHRILKQLTGLNDDAVERLLVTHHYHLRPAIDAHRRGSDR